MKLIQKKPVIKLPSGRPPAKSLDRTYQFKICLWLALYKDTPQIIDLLKDEFGIEFAHQTIDENYRYGKKWQPIIKYLRERYLKNISRIPIANKHYRLAMLQEALREALTWHTKSINQWGIVQEKKVGVIPQILEQARVEIEGQKPLVDQSTHLHLTNIKESIEYASSNGNGKARDRALENIEGSRELAK